MDAGGRVVFLQPGFSLYIPGGWYHQVSNLEESMFMFIALRVAHCVEWCAACSCVVMRGSALCCVFPAWCCVVLCRVACCVYLPLSFQTRFL